MRQHDPEVNLISKFSLNLTLVLTLIIMTVSCFHFEPDLDPAPDSHFDIVILPFLNLTLKRYFHTDPATAPTDPRTLEP